MANRLKIGSAMTKVDWALMMQDAYALRDLGKVAHVQPYLPGEPGSPAIQPFILILQDQWMLEMCERLTLNNYWEIDSTFKTNQFGLPWELGSRYGTCFVVLIRGQTMSKWH